MELVSRMQNIMFGENKYTPYNYYMTVICNRTAAQKDTF